MCMSACTTYYWAGAECLTDSVTCKTTAPRGPSLVNLRWLLVHSSTSWLTSRETVALCNGCKSLWAGEGGSRVEGGLVGVNHHCLHLMESALTEWPQTVARRTLGRPHVLLWCPGMSWAAWAEGVASCYSVFLNTIAGTVPGVPDSHFKTSSLQGLCPQQGNDLERWFADFVSGPNQSVLCSVLQGKMLPWSLWPAGFHLTPPTCFVRSACSVLMFSMFFLKTTMPVCAFYFFFFS